MTEEEHIVEARDNLAKAIQAYQNVANPGEFVTDWVVLTQRNSIQLEQQSRRALGVLCAGGQSFITTRGMLESAVDLERLSSSKK